EARRFPLGTSHVATLVAGQRTFQAGMSPGTKSVDVPSTLNTTSVEPVSSSNVGSTMALESGAHKLCEREYWSKNGRYWETNAADSLRAPPSTKVWASTS